MRLSKPAQQALSHVIRRLFCIARSGYSIRGVSLRRVQSVGRHVANGKSIVGTLAQQEGLSKKRCKLLWNVHDLLERVYGDILPIVRNFHKDNNLEEEFDRLAFSRLLEYFPLEVRGEIDDFLAPLLAELGKNKTPCAQVIHDTDIIERGIKSKELLSQGYREMRDIVQETEKLLITRAGKDYWKTLGN